MVTCSACDGLVPDGNRRCVHCNARITRRRRLLAMLVGSAGTMLLAACYGPAGRYQGAPMRPTPADRDGDGAPADIDCDDNDPTRYPGAEDPYGDGIDQNCDGVDGWRDQKQQRAAPGDGGPEGN